MNPDNSSLRLLYELNAKSAQLDLSIQQAERQLASVNKKLKSLWHDLAFYIAMAILPEFIYQITARIKLGTLLLPFLTVFLLIFRCVYIISLPFVIFRLFRTIYLLKLNREKTATFSEPVRLDRLRDKINNNLEREPSYRAEQKKLIFILTRYYLNRDIIEQFRRQISESDSCTLTFAELRVELSKLPFYEDVRPAETYKAGNIVIPTIIAFIILILYAFRMWNIV